MHNRFTFYLFLVGLFCLLSSAAIGQTKRYVSTTGSNANPASATSWATATTDLQGAINSLTATGGQVWVAGGVYKPTTYTDPDSRTVSFAMHSNVAIYGGFVGTETTLTGPGGRTLTSPSSTTLSGEIDNDNTNTNNSYHVVTNSQTTNIVLDGFVITSGNANGSDPNNLGGGMYNEGFPTLANCFFYANSATGSGGGLYNNGGSTMTNCSFQGNSAPNGGGIYSANNPTLTNCSFQSNSATNGGGMYNTGGSPTLINSTFQGNSATGSGAGMYSANTSQPKLTNCSFQNNSGNQGGGMYSSVCSLTLTNCSFQGNSATSSGGGGGMYNNLTTAMLTNCSFQGNSANFGNFGGAILNGVYNTTLINCVLFDNGGSTSIKNFSGGSVSASYSLFESGVTGFTDTGNNITGVTVSPFASTTGTQLNGCSPAINAGSNAAFTAATSLTVDLAGNPRFYSNGTVDMGAYEFQATPTIITLTNPSISTAVTGVSFSQSFSASGGTGPYIFSLDSGTLPTGLTLASTGVLSGTPTQTGTFTMVPQTTDNAGCLAVGTTYSLTITPGLPTVTGFDVSPDPICAGQAATFTATIGNVSGSYAYTLTNGTSTSTGTTSSTVLSQSWTASGSGTQTFTLTVADNGYSTTVATTLTVNVLPTANILAPASTTLTCTTPTLTLTATGGGTYRWANNTTSDTRIISTNGLYSVTVTSPAGCTALDTQFINSAIVSITVTNPAVTTAMAGVGITRNFTASSTGTASRTFTIVSGTLPTGLNLTTAGVLTGNPTQSGSFTVVVRATDSNGCFNDGPSYVLTVSGITLSGFDASPDPTCEGGVATFVATVANAIGSYNYTLTNGSNTTASSTTSTALSQTMVLAGFGSQTFTLTVSDNGVSATATTTLMVSVSIAYVTPTGAGLQNGSSWSNAYAGTDLQTAINSICAGGQVWVAAGVYKPTTTTTRTISFAMKNGVAIYGGFAGTETALTGPGGRTLTSPVTGAPTSSTLSGDIGNVGVSTDNSYHVIRNPKGLDGSAILDGFVITGGNANGSAPNNNGGGVYNDAQWPGFCYADFRNCIFQGNSASSSGGAVYNNALQSVGNPSFLNCLFQGNSAGSGGALFNDGGTGVSSPVLTNCSFQGNSAGSGGAIYNSGNSAGTSNPVLTNCSLQSNSATLGGAFYNFGFNGNGGNPVLFNCFLQGNTASANGGAFFNYGNDGYSNPRLINCSLQGNSAPSGGAFYNTGFSGNSNPILTNCVLWNNGGTNTVANNSASLTANFSLFDYTAGVTLSGPGNLTTATTPFASATSAALSGCSLAIDAGSNGDFTGETNLNTDLTGNYRFYNTIIDMGASEFQGASLSLTNPNVSSATVGSAFSQTFTLANGTSPYTFTQLSGSLPAGLTLATSGVLSGTATETGTFTMVVQVTDAVGCTAVGSTYSLTVIQGLPSITSFAANPATVCAGQTATFTATIGNVTGSYDFTLTNGTSTTTGTTTALSQSWTASGSGTQTFTLTVADNGSTTFVTTTLRVNTVSYTVTTTADSGPGSLRQAMLDIANSTCLSSFTVHVTATGIISLTSNLPNIAKDIAFIGPGANNLTISRGSGSFRFFTILGNNTVSFDGFTIADGSMSGAGGAIYSAGRLTVANCIFRTNRATTSGGGIYNTNQLVITNTQFDSNTATGNGGAIFNDGGSSMLTSCSFTGNRGSDGGAICNSGHTAALSNCVIQGNTSTNRGGGLFNSSGSSTLTSCTIAGNQATAGGGVYTSFTSTATLTNCVLQSNSVTNSGGGLYMEGGNSTLASCTITSNQANNGGAIAYIGHPAILNNCMIQGNIAANNGGGLYSSAGSSTLTSCTIAGNRATNGGGMYASFTHTATMTNCLLQSNSATTSGGGLYANSGNYTVVNGSFETNQATSLGGAIYTSSTVVVVTNASFRSNSAGTGTVFYINSGTPQLTNGVLFGNGLASNAIAGGTLQATYSLFEQNTGGFTTDPTNLTTAVSPFVSTTGTQLNACAPAINTGDNSAMGITTDLESNTRVFGGTIDMGAYEFQSNPMSININNPATTTAAVGTAFSQTFTATGGSSPYTFTLLSGSLPTGLTLTSSGVLSGTPTQSGTFTMVVQGTDAGGCGDLGSTYSLTVNPGPPAITGFAASPATVCVGQATTFTATIGNVTGSYDFTLTNGNSTTTGTTSNTVLSQTWTAGGASTQTFTLTVADNGYSTQATTTLMVNTPTALTITSAPTGQTITRGNTVTLTASGGLSYTWTIGAGLSGSAVNPFMASPTSTTVYSVTGLNAAGCSSVTSVTVTVNNPACYSVVYVTQSGAGLQNGSSWINAYPGTMLQTAINSATSCSGQVWVAAGIYKPTTGIDRSISFSMRNNVAIYGGFAGSETAVSGRPSVNPNTGPGGVSQPSSSTLSGDIGTANTSSDNSYHIITNPNGLTSSAILDGFVLADGNATGSSLPTNAGGAIYNNSLGSGQCSPTIRNCSFQANSASSYGGAIYNNGSYSGSSSPVLTNCSFQSNSAVVGGAIYNDGYNSGSSSPVLINCAFRFNSTTTRGGAIYNNGTLMGSSSPVLTNSSFESNSATTGGAIYNDGTLSGSSRLVLTNCSFQSNSATTGGAIYNDGDDSRPVLANCVLFNNGGNKTIYNYSFNTPTSASFSLFDASVTGYSGLNNLTTTISPFISTIGTQLNACAPAINTGDNSATGLVGITTDLESNTRVFGGTVDMGAYEFQGTPNSIVLTNPATTTAVVGAAFSQTFTVTGSSPYSFTLLSGSLPTGLTLASTGILSGTPSQSGTFTIVVQGTDAGGCTDAGSTYSLTVNSAIPTISSFAPTTAAVCTGQATTFTATVGNVTGSYNFTLTNGTSHTTGSTNSTAFSQSWTAGGYGIQSFTLTVSANGTFTTAITSLTVGSVISNTAINYWGGCVSSDWQTASNWSKGRVPIATDDVVLLATAPNQPNLTGAAVAYSVEVPANTTLTIGNSGTLILNGSRTISGAVTTFQNDGAVENSGVLILGNTASLGNSGIRNTNSFTNKAGGLIAIDNVSGAALVNLSGTFINSSTLSIGSFAAVGQNGIINSSNLSVFINTAGGLITIDRCSIFGLQNSGTFENSGAMLLGNNASVGNTASLGNGGIANSKNFTNKPGGIITIDNTALQGLSNSYSSTFVNSSTITIGASVSVGVVGLYNYSTFNNTSGGLINIDQVTDQGIYNQDGTFTNSGILTIGGSASAGQAGLYNAGTFANATGAQINIDRSAIEGLHNTGTFSNSATITIGASASVGQYGLYNFGIFTNSSVGQINIDNSSSIGLLHIGTFANSGTITIGANAAVGSTALGVSQLNTVFTNSTGGLITLARSTTVGVDNYLSTINNAGTIRAGSIAGVGQYGLRNDIAFFNNLAGGMIYLDGTTDKGLLNARGAFTNSSTILIGSVSAVGATGVSNGTATFANSGCSALLKVASDAVITNSASGTFTNTGTIIENAGGNSNISSNAGLVLNQNGGTFTTGTGPNGPLSLTGTAPTVCSPANGSFTLTGLQANTTYSLSYTLNGTPTTVSPNPVSNANGQVTLSGLSGGAYAFSLSGSCVAGVLPLSATLNAPTQLTIATQPSAGSVVCAGVSVTASIGLSGTATSYQWYKDGVSLGASQTATTLSLTNVQTDATGSYSVVATASCNSVTSSAFSLTVNPLPSLTVTANPSFTIFNGNTVTLTASGATSYTWTGNVQSATFTASPINTTTYSVTGLTASGCTSVTSVTVTVNAIPCGAVIYVAASGSGLQDGSSWANALPGTMLQAAITRAASCSAQVWVAGGLYKPTTFTGPGSRTISFSMRNSVAIYGGFTVGQTDPAQRNLSGPSSSTLSGEIDDDNTLTNNSYHVIANSSLNSTARLDGFVITGANANGVGPYDLGGGMYNNSSSPTLFNCNIQSNSAANGGGMYNAGSSPTLTNCTLQNNGAALGGGIYNTNSSSSPTLTNCLLQSNTATQGGGIFNNFSSHPTLISSTLRGNVATDLGGGIYNSSSSNPTLTNCTLESNSSLTSSGGGIYHTATNNIRLVNCSFLNNSAKTYGGGMLVTNNSTAELTNCSFQGNTALSTGLAFFVTGASSSLTLINSVVWNTGAANELAINVSNLVAYNSLFAPSSLTLSGVSSLTGNLIITVSPFASTTSTELAACSPAIDAGDNSATGLTGITTDLAGNSRFYNSGTVDMGAYEFQGEGSPISFSVLGSGTATCTASPTITLSGSETGVSYQLQRDGSNLGSSVAGTGSAISFGTQPTSGTYTVVASRTANSCTAVMATSATVVSSTAVPTVSISASSGTLTCAQTSVTLTATSSETALLWSDGSTTTSITVNTAATYSVTVTNSSGCTAVGNSLTISQNATAPTSPTLTASHSGTLTCTNPALTLTASATGSGLTYTFSGTGIVAQSGSSATVNQAGTFTVVITGGNGCTTSASTTVYSNTTAPAVTLTTNQTITCASPTVTLTATSGLSNYRFSTSQNGTSNLLTVTSAGTYSVVATAANGCTALASTTVVSSSAVISASLVASGAISCSSTSVTLTASPANLTYVFGGAASQIGSTNQATVSSAGTYSVTVTDAGGCSAVAQVTVTGSTTAPTGATLTTSLSGILTCTNPALTLTASATGSGLTYTFSGTGIVAQSGSSATVNQAGTFTVVITGGNGCTTSASTTVYSNTTAPAVTLTTNQTITCASPTATLTATSGLSNYRFSTGQNGTSNLLTVSSAGTYSVVATGANGCTALASTTVVSSSAVISASLVASGAISCSSTSVTLTASPANLTYVFGGGASQIGSTNRATVSGAGTYSVTVTDAGGCSAVAQVTVTGSTTAPTLLVSPTTATLTCASPSVILSAIGSGTAVWSTNVTGSSLTVSIGGIYSVTLIGSNGCSTVASATVVDQNVATTISSLTASGVLSCSTTVVGLQAVGSGLTYQFRGPGGYVYSEVFGSVSSRSVSATGITQAGVYTLVVSQGASCSTSQSVTVVQSSQAVSLSVSSSGGIGCGQSSAVISVVAPGASSFTVLGPGSYSQTSGSGQFTVVQGGAYTVVAGSGGCSARGVITIAEGGVQPVASNFRSGGVLGSGRCSVPLLATATGDRYAVTGASGYVYSNVYRTVGTRELVGFSVNQPGTYILTVYSGTCVATYTTVVVGTACSGGQ